MSWGSTRSRGRSTDSEDGRSEAQIRFSRVDFVAAPTEVLGLPVGAFAETQGRFRPLTPGQVGEVVEHVAARWEQPLALASSPVAASPRSFAGEEG